MKSGSFEEAARELLQSRKDFTVNGKCSGCGECCSNLLPLTDKEIEAIRRYIQKHKIKENIKQFPLADVSLDMTCPFRNNEKRICEIYAVRPAICRVYMCNKEATADIGREFMRESRRPVLMREEFYKKGDKR